MATNFGTTISGSYFRIVVVSIASTATNFFNAAVDTAVRFGRYVRNLFVDEPLLPRGHWSCPPIVTDERVIARSAAPIVSLEPAFVGGGLAFRRWR